jgi:hypothetical protein
MEILSSSDWGFEQSGDMFKANLYVEVNEFIDKKIEALSAYRNVMRDFPHPRSNEVLKGLAAYRGGQSGQLYSEAFQNIFQQEL